MPVDPAMLDMMLDTFRNMAGDIKEKEASGGAFDRMMNALKEMERLGREMDDFSAYSAKITSDGLQMKFSTAYGEAMGEMTRTSMQSGSYDDSALLKQTLDAYRAAVKRLRESREEAKKFASSDTARHEVDVLSKNELIIKPIEELIKLGESGISYPVFLRLMIEKGLDAAMQGAPVVRAALEYDLGWAQAMNISPHHIAEKQDILDKFDEIASKSAFSAPDPVQFELERQKIEHRHAPLIARWDAISYRRDTIIYKVHLWALAHTKFAPNIFPWSQHPHPKESVEMDKDCIPGDLKVLERIFKEYFNMGFLDIFKHETFLNEVKNFGFDYSQEWTEFLIRNVYPGCQPMKHMDKSLIPEVERFHEYKLCYNPELRRRGERVQRHYDGIFGQGQYAKKHPPAESIESKSRPWDLASFKL